MPHHSTPVVPAVWHITKKILENQSVVSEYTQIRPVLLPQTALNLTMVMV